MSLAIACGGRGRHATLPRKRRLLTRETLASRSQPQSRVNIRWCLFHRNETSTTSLRRSSKRHSGKVARLALNPLKLCELKRVY